MEANPVIVPSPERQEVESSPSNSKNVKLTLPLEHIITETILGYLFWSVFFGLMPMIWFYPLNELDFTGYEAFITIVWIPVICGVSFVFKFIQSRCGLALLRIIVLASICSFQLSTTFSRLVMLSIGTGASLLVLASTLWSKYVLQRYVTFWGLMLSFFLMIVSRIWYVSIIPTWSDVQSNNIVIALGTVATSYRIFISKYDELALQYEKHTMPVSNKYNHGFNWIFIGMGFGSLLYITISVFGEVSIIFRWVVKGHPLPGPEPNPYGLSVLASLAFGLGLSKYPVNFLTSVYWWIFGTAGLMILYYYYSYVGFVGGLVLGVYVMSVWPVMVDRLTICPVARTFTLAMFTFTCEMLFSIWTIAYNFVPGGQYTREHTDYLLIFAILTVMTGLVSRKHMISQTAYPPAIEKDRAFHKNVYFVFIFLLLLGMSGFVTRNQSWQIQQRDSKSETKEFSALIWTYHFGFDNQGWPSFERSAQVLEETGADFITLLESDASKPYLGNNDLAMWMQERLSMYTDFGPSTKDHTWGNLILSKYPIVKSEHHLLPSPYGELAPAISATVNVSGTLIDFVTTHMGNDRDNIDRQLQAEYLANILDKSENPIVFLGYVTSAPGSRDYIQLTKKGRMKDIDATDQDRWCEYIMYRRLIRLGYARISHGGLSDTELQMAKFRIPDGEEYTDNDAVHIDILNVPYKQLFTDKFGTYQPGHYRSATHHYHARTPKYFLPN